MGSFYLVLTHWDLWEVHVQMVWFWERALSDPLSIPRSTSLGTEKSLLHKTYKSAWWTKQSLKISEKSCTHSYSVTASVHGPFTRHESEWLTWSNSFNYFQYLWGRWSSLWMKTLTHRNIEQPLQSHTVIRGRAGIQASNRGTVGLMLLTSVLYCLA